MVEVSRRDGNTNAVSLTVRGCVVAHRRPAFFDAQLATSLTRRPFEQGQHLFSPQLTALRHCTCARNAELYVVISCEEESFRLFAAGVQIASDLASGPQLR